MMQMKASSARENILKKIRQALSKPVPVPFSNIDENSNIFLSPQEEPEIEFAENFTRLQGKFSFCADEKEMTEQLKILIDTRKWKNIYCREDVLKKILFDSTGGFTFSSELHSCDAAITGCELLIARTGSILLSSAQQSGRTVSVYAPVHVCIAYTHQLVYDVKDALQLIKEKYQAKMPSLISFATGPSRTADIEKTLVVGVHGPKEVFCFLIDAPIDKSK